MNVSRGGFLKLFGAALVGLRARAASLVESDVFAAMPAAPGSRAAGPFDWTLASASFFQPHLHTIFTGRTDANERVPLVLEAIADQGIGDGIERFSLRFRAPAGRAIDGTCAMHHAALGEFELFISSVGRPNERSAVCEACFSRRITRT